MVRIGFFTLLLALVWVGPVWASCPVAFTYDASLDPASEVLLSGTFNGWGSAPPDAWSLTDGDGDQIWELEVELPIDTYLYKFILDGSWIPDPANPDQDPDGGGGFNSVLDVVCPEPFFHLLHSAVDQVAGSYRATCLFASAGAELDSASVAVTLDHQPVPAGSFLVVDDQVQIQLDGIPQGIHDVRLTASDLTGRPALMSLLKVYLGHQPEWSDVTLYFTMTDRFRNGDPGNDDPFPGLPWATNYQGGDFQGIMDAIQEGYFDLLGVNALWLSWPGDGPDHPETGSYVDTDDCNIPPGAPGYPLASVEFSAFHGYWPAAEREVEEHFGSLEELQELVHVAHARGIRVLLDLTINHVHSDSPFFSDHPTSFFNYPVEICEEIGWSAPETCWFTSSLPDIRYEDARAARSVLRTAAWWVEQTGCDGYRVDALKHIYYGFISDLRAYMDSRFAGTGVPFYLVGETFSGNPDDIAAYIGEDLVHGQFNFPLNLSILKAFGSEEIGLDDLFSDTRSFSTTYREAHPDSIMSNFLGNHDIARFLSVAAGDMTCPIWDNISHNSQGWRNPPDTPSNPIPYRKLRLAFTYLMTIPGIPLIYYGDEYGQPGAGDPDNRRALLAPEELNLPQTETLSSVRLLGTLRQEWNCLREREMGAPLRSTPTFLAFARIALEDRAVVALNRSGEPQTETFRVWGTGLPDGAVLPDALGGDPVTVNGEWLTVTLEPYGAAIYTYQSTEPATPTPTPTVQPTPTPSEIALRLELDGDGDLGPGERLLLTVSAFNPTAPRVMDVYVLLEAGGQYYFWPSWGLELDHHSEGMSTGSTYQEVVLDFSWPDSAGTGSAAFWGALFAGGTYDSLAAPEYVPIQWHP